ERASARGAAAAVSGGVMSAILGAGPAFPPAAGFAYMKSTLQHKVRLLYAKPNPVEEVRSMKPVLPALLSAALAATILSAPAWAQDAHGAHASEMNSAHGHHPADFDSGRFHVRIDGPEQPQGDVILIPGLSSSPHVWDLLTDELKGRYRVHRIHVQGFAGAAAEDNAEGPVSAPVAEDIARYIREQGLDRPAVIGHSMGGTIGMMLAARHPDSVGRLMVVDMIPFVGAMFGEPGTNPTPESIAPMADMIYQGMANAPR